MNKLITDHPNKTFHLLSYGLLNLVILLLSMLLYSCTPNEQAIIKAIEETQNAGMTATSLHEQNIVVVVVTATPDPNADANGNDIPVEASETPTVTPTLAQECLEDLSQIEVYGIGYLDNGNFLVSFENNDQFIGQDYSLDIGLVTFECEILPRYPTRLYCNGSTLQAGLEVEIFIHPGNLQCSLYQTQIAIPEKIAVPVEDDSGGSSYP